MRIGLCGSHGTGKSSLVQKWIQRHPEYYTPAVEVSRKVVAKGYGVNFDVTLEGQKAFIASFWELVYDLCGRPNAITSRTLFDFWAYNLYFYRRPQYGLTKELMEEVKGLLECAILKEKTWDLYVYCPILWELTEQNQFREGQVGNQDYQKEIDAYVFAFLTDYSIPYITLNSTNDEERLLQIENALH